MAVSPTATGDRRLLQRSAGRVQDGQRDLPGGRRNGGEQSRKGGERAVEGRGKAVNRQWYVEERQ